MRALLVTFSGLDGSGKSTLAASLADDLRATGHRARILRMYDVSFYAYLRGARDAVRRGARTLSGRPAAPPRRGSGSIYAFARNVTVRRLSYFADMASALSQRLVHQALGGEVLLLDRYLYDLLVDVAGEGWPTLGALLALTPRPDVPVYVDVAPDRAFARKGEFDLPYLERRSEVYRWIFARVRDPLIVQNEDLARARETLRDAVLARLA